MLMGKRVLATVALVIAGTQQSRAADQWQYGELHYDPRIRVEDNKPRVLWGTSSAVVEGGDWEGMAEKLKALEDLPKETPRGAIVIARRVQVLNAIGRDGWEMVGHTLKSDAESETWVFKRAAPPSPAKPDAGAPQSSTETVPMKISVNGNGKISRIELNGSPVSEDDLRKKLAALPEDARNVFEVNFVSQAEVPYEDIARLMDLINQAGIHKITIPSLVHEIQDARPVEWPFSLMSDIQEISMLLGGPLPISEIDRLQYGMAFQTSELDREMKSAGDDQAKREAVQAKIKALQERTAAQLAKLLTPKQLALLKQFDLQVHGVNAFLVPEVQEALGFDEVQKGRITIVLADVARQQDSLFAAPGRLAEGLNILDFQKKAAQQAAERDRKIDAILTDEQRAKLAEMKGKRIYPAWRGERNPWTAPDPQSPPAPQ